MMPKSITYTFGSPEGSIVVTTADDPSPVVVDGSTYQALLVQNVSGTFDGQTVSGRYGAAGYEQEDANGNFFDNAIFLPNQGFFDTTYGLDNDGIEFVTPAGVYNLYSSQGAVYYITPDGSGGGDADVSYTNEPAVVCFASGTLIRTARGDVAVERLAVGDVVVTAAGAHRPIRWLGHRDTDCARHPEPRRVWPVRVAAGALGAGLPYADLWLSPGHALCLDEVLIPARCLVHGDAIAQVERDAITYWHVELDTHDILVANGVAAESYLDTGNRPAFDNAPGATDLHPDFEPRHTRGFCRPVVESGPLLAAARARLFGAAAAPVSEPVHMLADGVALRGMVGRDEALFMIPAGTRELRLVSPRVRGDGADRRTLGLNVNALRIEDGDTVRRVALDDPGLFAGFHHLESGDGRSWRWTDGDAHLAPSLWEGFAGAFLLRIGGMFERAGHAADGEVKIAA